ncbi:MAG: hypothetical protein KJ646_02035 [Nanoarchaeota archaeon]|nr:hypothetical protein [Nanoarchaeota archaeon]MBU4116864.1 hypothetical protein [Nanoarchaeota archaeon]
MEKRSDSTNRLIYTLILLGIFILIGIGTFVVNAFNTNEPSVFGHSIGEMDWSKSIPSLKADTLEAGSINLGGVPRTSWPAEGISSGFCVFSRTQTGCPAGWTRDSGFDSRTIRGAATPGGIDGSESHTHTGVSHTHTGGSYALTAANLAAHTHSYTTLAGSGTPGYSYWLIPDSGTGAKPLSVNTGSAGSGTAHSHGATSASGTGATSSTSSWPPYMNVIVCCKN